MSQRLRVRQRRLKRILRAGAPPAPAWDAVSRAAEHSRGRVPADQQNHQVPDEVLAMTPEWAGGFGVRIEGFKQMVSDVAQSLGKTHRELRVHAMNVALFEVWEEQYCYWPDVRVGNRWINGRKPVIPKDALSAAELTTWIRRQAEAAAVKYVRDEHGVLAGKDWTPRPDRRRDMPPQLWREPDKTAQPRRRSGKLVEEARRMLPNLPDGQPKRVAELVATGSARTLADVARCMGASPASIRKAFCRARQLASNPNIGAANRAPRVKSAPDVTLRTPLVIEPNTKESQSITLQN